MKGLYYTLASMLVLFIAYQASAQTGEIVGSIKTNDGLSAEFVNVYLKGTGKGTITDSDGMFKLQDIGQGNYTLVASSVGLKSVTQKVEVIASQTTAVSFELEVDGKELEEIVVRANPVTYVTDYPSVSLRLKTPLLQTPQNIQVVNSQTIKDQQIFDMQEGVIRNVSGATRSEHWENYARIVMRGSRIASFRNGMNVTNTWGPLNEDMSMVERIEFVKGPAGFMLASGEPSGFYNIVTKKPTGITKSEVGMTVGSFGTYRATLDFDGKLNKDGKILYRLNLMGQQKGTQRNFEFNNRISVAPVVKFQINPGTSLTAEYNFQYAQMSPLGSNYIYSPNALGDLPVDFTTLEPNMSPTTIDDHSLTITLVHSIDDNWKFTGQLAYLNFSQLGQSLWPTGFDGDTLLRAASNWDILGITKVGQFFLNGDLQTGSLKHRILAGLDMGNKDFYHDWSQGGSFSGPEGFNVYNPIYGQVPASAYPVYDRKLSLRERGVWYNNQYAALYVQDEIRMFNEHLRLTLAGRYTTTADEDPYSGQVDSEKFTPRIGLSYSLNKSMSVYAVYDQAFIPQTGATYEGEKFEPIIGDNKEIGFKTDWLNGMWTATVSAYRITKNNELTADPDHQFFSIPIGQTQTQGIEIDVRGQLIDGLNVTMNYAFTDGKITEDSDETMIGRQIPGTDKHIANAWLNYRFMDGGLDGLGLSFGARYAGDRSAWYAAYDPSIDPAMPDFTTFDAAVSYQFKKMGVALNVSNLFNADMISGAYYSWSQFYYWQAQAYRNFRLTLNYKF